MKGKIVKTETTQNGLLQPLDDIFCSKGRILFKLPIYNSSFRTGYFPKSIEFPNSTLTINIYFHDSVSFSFLSFEYIKLFQILEW